MAWSPSFSLLYYQDCCLPQLTDLKLLTFELFFPIISLTTRHNPSFGGAESEPYKGVSSMSYQRFDVNGRDGRVSFRRFVDATKPEIPLFRIYRKKRGTATFLSTNETLPRELEEFMGNLMRAQEHIMLPSMRPATVLRYEDLIELYEDMCKAAKLLRNFFEPVYLFRTMLQNLGHGYVSGREKLPQ